MSPRIRRQTRDIHPSSVEDDDEDKGMKDAVPSVCSSVEELFFDDDPSPFEDPVWADDSSRVPETLPSTSSA